MPYKDPAKRRECVNAWKKAHLDKVRAQNRAIRKAWRDSHLDEARERDREWRKSHPEQCRAYEKRYRSEHKEQTAATAKEYQHRNLVKVKVWKTEWNEANREKIKAQNKSRYDARSGELRTRARERGKERYRVSRNTVTARNKAWRLAHPGYNSLRSAAYRARKAGAQGFHTVADKESIWKRQRGRCTACQATLQKTKGFLNSAELDHVIALKNGGSHWPENLQWLCRSCNSQKQAQDDILWAQKELGLLFVP